MKSTKRVLEVNTVGFQYEGISSVILNYIGAMNRDGLEFTFLVYADTPQKLKETLSALGAVATVPDRKKDVKGYIAQMYHILGEGYDVLHVHGNSGTMLIETVLAKLRGVKKVIVHTHNTTTSYPLANAVMKYPMMFLADEQLACSRAAGEWLYGNHPYTVLNNAIDIERFRFDLQKREHYRKEFGVQKDEFLIGHIGNFNPQKNHIFLLEIFKAYLERDQKSKLLLIGDGPDQPRVKEKARELGIWDQVIFAGRRNDAFSIYSAMDLFLLPSRWEGLSLVTLEAQANGLPALVSDRVPQEVNCTDHVFFEPLTDTAQEWASNLETICKSGIDRTADTYEDIAGKGFDIFQEAENLRKIYLS